ncbi:MAG: AAA family ATPase, partial [Psychrobacillus sp.]
MTTGEFYINSVYIKNFRRFEEVSIEFNKGFNILVGPNGSGKTSILIALSMSISVNAIEDSRVEKNSEIWTEVTDKQRKYRIGLGPNWGETISYRNTQLISLAPPPFEDGKQSVGIQQIQEFIPNFCPLFIGAYRKFNYTQINGMTREEAVPHQRNLYRDNAVKNLNGINLPNIKQWLINRYFLIEKEWAENEKLNWEWL